MLTNESVNEAVGTVAYTLRDCRCSGSNVFVQNWLRVPCKFEFLAKVYVYGKQFPFYHCI